MASRICGKRQNIATEAVKEEIEERTKSGRMCEQKYETETEQDNDGDEKSNIVNKKQDERSKVWFV